DPALVVELRDGHALALVPQDDTEPTRQECGLPEALQERVDRPLELLEDLGVRQKRDRRAGLLSLADSLELGRRVSARKLLPIDVAATAHLDDEPFRERVHDRDADSVQAPGDLVALAPELAAGVELREHDRDRRQ